MSWIDLNTLYLSTSGGTITGALTVKGGLAANSGISTTTLTASGAVTASGAITANGGLNVKVGTSTYNVGSSIVNLQSNGVTRGTAAPSNATQGLIYIQTTST